VEIPMGTTLREVIYEIGGGCPNNKNFKAVQTGGPSGGCLTDKHLDTKIDFDNLISLGSMMDLKLSMIESVFIFMDKPYLALYDLYKSVIESNVSLVINE
jgi:NADH:ubiquinone oxidoreductase subunit F (NADH-binding)